jgi:hypothetical protein
MLGIYALRRIFSTYIGLFLIAYFGFLCTLTLISQKTAQKTKRKRIQQNLTKYCVISPNFLTTVHASVAGPGCFIPDLGSEIFTFRIRISDPGS